MEVSQKPSHVDNVINERKEKFFAYLKKNTVVVSSVLLALIVFLAVKIRIANLSGLKDITTGGWTLGPDLDPFLFLRWADYIVQHGTLMTVDAMRYVPLGFDTSYELTLHVYLMVWFHKLAAMFGSESITQSAVLYPVFMFALAVIAFFFMVRKMCLSSLGDKKSNVVALVASFFLSVTPALLPRTIAGIPEKEASGLLFLFLAFYFFLTSWDSKSSLTRYTSAVLAGLSTAVMGLVWGGYLYILITISPFVFFAFISGNVTRERKILYVVWFAVTLALLLVSTNRYSLSELLTSTTTIPLTFLVFIFVLDEILFSRKVKPLIDRTFFAKIPRPLTSVLIALVLGVILASVLFGPSFIGHNISQIKKFLVTTSVDRLNVTVAENRQPYFLEWVQSFGPVVFNLSLVFWMFFLGSILVFFYAVKSFNKKARLIATAGFVLFLISLVFSRYAPDSSLNGTNAVSLLFYVVGPLALLFVLGRYYFKCHASNENEPFKSIDFNLVFLLCFFVISLLSARGGVRLVMMLVPSASILLAYLVVEVSGRALENRKRLKENYLGAIIAIILLVSLTFSGYVFYRDSFASAKVYVPSVYTQQWQKAMAWTRENTSPNAVFGHWWDYGYWVQSIGERATVLDGGNAKSYWNHMMGRYALTGTSNQQALDFLYAHNTTHFLIDPTDIGKYGAFSSIGSDKDYDRVSFIATLNRDNNQVLERKNSTLFVYTGGVPLDDDIHYTLNGTKIFLPKGNAALGAVLIERDSLTNELIQAPQGVFVYRENQYILPLRYAFDGHLIDFEEGLTAGIFLMPRLANGANGLEIEKDSTLLYLSARTVQSQFARLYLYQEPNENFKLVHSEDDLLIAQIKSSVPDFEGDFIVYDSIRGPIRIWEINYPSAMTLNEAYLSEAWPPELLRA